MKKTYNTPIIEIKDFEINTNITLDISQNPLDFANNPGESTMWEDL